MVKSKKVLERGENARKCMLEFLNLVKQAFKKKCVYALLKKRNPKNHPLVQDLLGLSEEETYSFFLLFGLVRGNNESYIRVDESVLKEIIMDSKLGFFMMNFQLHRTRQAQAYYISFPDQSEKENRDINEECPSKCAMINCCRTTFQSNVRKLLADHAVAKIAPGSPVASKNLKNDSRCRKATTPIADSPYGPNQQKHKRLNQNATPANFRSDQRQIQYSGKSKNHQSPSYKTSRSSSIIPKVLKLESAENDNRNDQHQVSLRQAVTPESMQEDSFSSFLAAADNSPSDNQNTGHHSCQSYNSNSSRNNNVISHNESNPLQEDLHHTKGPLNVATPYSPLAQYNCFSNLAPPVTNVIEHKLEIENSNFHEISPDAIYRSRTNSNEPIKTSTGDSNPRQQYLHTCIALALRGYLAQLIADSFTNDENFEPFIVSAILGASTAHIDKKQLPHLAAFWGVSEDKMQEEAMNYISSGAGQFKMLPPNWFIRYSKRNGRPFFISFINSDGARKKITSFTHPNSKTFSLEKCHFEQDDTAKGDQANEQETEGDTFAGTAASANEQVREEGMEEARRRSSVRHSAADLASSSGTTGCDSTRGTATRKNDTSTTGCTIQSTTSTTTGTTSTTALLSGTRRFSAPDRTCVESTNTNTIAISTSASTNGKHVCYFEAYRHLSKNQLDWYSSDTLKKSLQSRRDLQWEEVEIARLLNLHLMTTNQNGIQQLVFPRGRGQSEDTIFYKKPSKRKDSRCVVNSIASIVVDICALSDATLLSVIIALAKKEEGKISIQLNIDPSEKCNLILQSLALINIAGLSHNSYHAIRMFAKRIWSIKFGAPLDNITEYLKQKCPSSDCFSATDCFQVGSTEANADKKFKPCALWYHLTPWDDLGTKIKQLESRGVLVPTSEISSLSYDSILLVSNIDKGSDRTAVMVRIMNEDKGNSGSSTMVLGVLGDGANESHYNLSKAFFNSEQHPIKFTLQNLLNDTFVAMQVALSDKTRRVRITAWSVFCCLVADQIQSFPHHSNILIKEIENDKFLKSSHECLTIQTLDDFRNLHLLKHNQLRSFVAIALLSDSGTPLTWVTLGEEAISIGEMEVSGVKWKQLKGWEDSDGKMSSLLIGHQGPSSRFKCNSCIKTQKEIDDLNSITVLREEEYAPMVCFEKYINYGSCIGKADENARRDLSLNIAHRPLLDIPIKKRMFEPCHTLSGNMEHIDKILVKELVEIEKKSWIFSMAESVRNELSNSLKELVKERKIRATGVKWDRKNVIECQGIIDQNPNLGPNASVFVHRNEIVQRSKIYDNALQELDEHITIIEEALKHVTRYLDSEVTFLVVLVLDYSYKNAANVSLGNYHGGRKMLFRDALRVSVNFDSIAQQYVELMTKVMGNRDPNVVSECAEALEKAKKCTTPLGKLFTMAESQNKINPDKARLFQQYCFDFNTELRNQYPLVPLWLKAHWMFNHLSQIPLLFGFCGRANAEGFESCHVILNRIDDSSRGRKGSEQVMATFQKKLRASNLAGVGKIKQQFYSSGHKVINRRPVAKTASSSISSSQNISEVTSEKQVIFNRLNYSRCSITTCAMCGKRYPTSMGREMHVLLNHTAICLELLQTDEAEG